MGSVAQISKQPQLEGMKDELDQELTDLAVGYETVRDQRLAKQAKERERKNALELKMNEKGVTHYRDSENGIEAFFEVERNLKVRRIKQDKDGEANG